MGRSKRNKIRKQNKTQNTKKLVIKIKKNDLKEEDIKEIYKIIALISLLFPISICMTVSSYEAEGFIFVFLLSAFMFLLAFFLVSMLIDTILTFKKKVKTEKDQIEKRKINNLSSDESSSTLTKVEDKSGDINTAQVSTEIKKKKTMNIPWGIKIKRRDDSLVIERKWWKSSDSILIIIVSPFVFCFLTFISFKIFKDFDAILLIPFCIMLIAFICGFWQILQSIFNRTIITADRTKIISETKFFNYIVDSVEVKRKEFKGFVYDSIRYRNPHHEYNLYAINKKMILIETFLCNKQLIYVISKLDEYYGLDSLSDFDFDDFERNFVTYRSLFSK